jgi:hypothetical protein
VRKQQSRESKRGCADQAKQYRDSGNALGTVVITGCGE